MIQRTEALILDKTTSDNSVDDGIMLGRLLLGKNTDDGVDDGIMIGTILPYQQLCQ